MSPKKNKIKINGRPLEITAKRLTFFDVQAVAPLLMDGTMDFSQYWRHAFEKWLVCDDYIDIEGLTPSEVMGWLVFREAKLATSNGSSTGEQ